MFSMNLDCYRADYLEYERGFVELFNGTYTLIVVRARIEVRCGENMRNLKTKIQNEKRCL